MTSATLSRPGERSGPRARVLLALSAAVLLAHLGLLSGGFSGLSLDLFSSPGADAPGASPSAAPSPADSPPEALTPALPDPVRTSRVRWIVPKAPEPAPPPPAPPPPKPVPPPEPTPLPEPAPVALAPPPEPVPEPAPPPVEPVVEATAPPPVAAVPEPAAPVPATDTALGAEGSTGTVVAGGAGLGEASLPPATVAPSVNLRYAATAVSKGSNYTGTGQLDWRHDGQQYEARLTTRVLVFTVLEQTSVGRVTDKGLAPDRFADRRRSTERAAHFDRLGQRLRYSNNAPDGKLLPGTQDRLSVNFQLSALFNARPDAYAEGQVLRLPVTGIDVAQIWLFQIGPTTLESLPAGQVPARLLTQSPRRDYDRKVEVWLLPQYAHLPGRIRVTEPNGDYLDMQLKELPPLPGEVSNTP